MNLQRPIAVLALTLSASVACSANPKRQDAPAEPPPLVVPAADVAPFFMRQNLQITVQGREQLVDAVVQYDGTTVTTLFLTPVGRPYVRMTQTGDQVDICGPGVSRVPFDLRFVMQEIGLALLLSPLRDPSKTGALGRDSVAGPVEDRWRDGLLVERSIVESGTSMRYGWGESACPATIEIENPERAYRLEISTTQCEDQ